MHCKTEEDICQYARKQHIPLFANFDLTHQCNQKCIHCYNCIREERELSFKEVISVLDQLAEAGTIYLRLTGGEPLMRKDFFEISEYARKLGFALTIFTNATLITEEIAKKISRLFPLLVRISLYGPTADLHGKVTGRPGLFKKCISGIRCLSYEKIPIQVFIPLFNHYTTADLFRMKELVKEFGMEPEWGSNFSQKTNGSAEPFKYSLSKIQFENLLRKFPESREVLYLKNKIEGPAVCKNMRCCINIDPYGHIGVCHLVHSQKTVRHGLLADIWRNDPFIKSYREVTWDKMVKCRDCEILSFCYPCPATNLQFTGSLYDPPSFTCDRARLIVDLIRSLK